MKLYTAKYTLGEYSNQMIHVNTNTDFAVGVKVDGMELDKNSIFLVDGEGTELSATTTKNDYVVFETSSGDEPCDKKYAVKFNDALALCCDFYLTIDEQKTNIGNVSNTLSTHEVQFTGTFADGTEFDYTLFAK